jgi:glycosyltransferase involved in cell wall biosynthesis
MMDNELPLVSVIVPLFNREKFLPQLFKTLQSQTYKHFEIILIDDGSSDNAETWLADNKNLLTQHLIYKKQINAGPYSARNHGLSLAKGKYIAFQDSDDEWPTYHLTELVESLEKNPDIDWLFGSLQRIAHQTRDIVEESNFVSTEGKLHSFISLSTEQRDDVFVIIDPEIGEAAIQYCVPGSTQCAMIRKTVFEGNTFDDSYRTAYDRFFAMKCVLKGYKFAFVHKIHQIYHIHDEHISLVAGASAEKLERSAKTMLRGYESLLEVTNNKLERKKIDEQLARVYAWELSTALQQQSKYLQSSRMLLKAYCLSPFNMKYLKSMLVTPFKSILFHIQKVVK